MRKLFLILPFLCLASCDQVEKLIQPGPNQVIITYLDAITTQDYSMAYAQLASEDQSHRTIEVFEASFTDPSPIVERYQESVTHKVVAVQEHGKRATVIVETTQPDLEIMFKEVMGAALTGVFSNSDSSEDAIKEVIEEKYRDGKLPLTTKSVEHELLKEEGEWRVFANFKHAEELEAQRERISEALEQAKELRENKKYAQAVGLYQSVLDQDSDNNSAVTGLEETENELAEQNEKLAYIQKIKLFDFEAKRIDIFLNKNVPAVRFALKNEGDRSLDKVEVTVYFKDSDGDVIFEEDFLPVLVSDYSYRDSKPLKPNYVYRQEQGKYYTVEGLGPEWVGGAEAIITDIRFSD